jgi:DinB family
MFGNGLLPDGTLSDTVNVGCTSVGGRPVLRIQQFFPFWVGTGAVGRITMVGGIWRRTAPRGLLLRLEHGGLRQLHADLRQRQPRLRHGPERLILDHGFALEDLRALYAFSLDEDALRETPRVSAGFAPPRWLVLPHVVNHGTQHRTEFARYLRDCGHSPGDQELLDALEVPWAAAGSRVTPA